MPPAQSWQGFPAQGPPQAYASGPGGPRQPKRGKVIALSAIAVAVVAAVTVTAVVLLGGDESGGDAARGNGQPPGEAGIPAYEPENTAEAHSTAEWDQPLPLPVDTECAWTDDAMPDMERLGFARAGVSGTGCQFIKQDENTVVQVRTYQPYNEVTQDSQLMEPVEVAGLTGRKYDFGYSEDSTHCSVELDVRSLGSLAVDGYARDDGGDRDAHCDMALSAAEALAARYVPLAGGTPHPDAPQGPPDDALAGGTACDVVGTSVVYFGISSEGGRQESDERGDLCRFEEGDLSLDALVTAESTGLAGLPATEGATVTETSLGPLPLRTEQTPDRCVVSAEFGNGQVLSLDLGSTAGEAGPATCLAGRVVLAETALSALGAL
ncbi:hypothetical protein [Prauserella marina]|uniref:hypothetical protein n=1 Tax=Prauserella marina TaxID=530584 RepID=UPI00115FD4AC|nr:hypothetical protein [Prauserella marina]